MKQTRKLDLYTSKDTNTAHISSWSDVTEKLGLTRLHLPAGMLALGISYEKLFGKKYLAFGTKKALVCV